MSEFPEVEGTYTSSIKEKSGATHFSLTGGMRVWILTDTSLPTPAGAGVVRRQRAQPPEIQCTLPSGTPC